MNKREELERAFPIGVKYCQHRDMQEKYWDTDFANMRDCGIDAIRVHAFWAPIEPQEGCFDFGQYDRITEKAGQYGIKVMFTLYLMSAPEWIFHKHPDSRFVSANGTVWNSNQFPDNAHGGWPGLCFDSQPFRQTVENFVKTFILHFKGNENVLAVDIWHEPCDEATQTYGINDWKDKTFCYCEHSIQGFKDWLKDKYGSLEELNHVWTRHFNSWDEVEPPRNIGTYTDWLDWRNYRIDAQVDSVDWLNKVVKKYDEERATSVHMGIFELSHPITHNNDQFKLALLTDMFACSCYNTVEPDVSGISCEIMRSSCNNGSYWIGETETGSGPMFVFLGNEPEYYHCFSRPADSDEIFNLTWSSIARGSKGIFFWGWRPDISTVESISLGFAERNGELTERTDALKEFTSIFRKYRNELSQAYAPKSEMAILYNMDSVLLEGLVSLMNSNKASTVLKDRFYKDMLSFIGCYRLCMKNGIQPDFVSREQADEGKLSRYKTVLLPYSISITTETANAIASYVENGGTVVSDAMMGFFTDDGWASEECPPHGLRDIFGLYARSNYELIKHCGIDTERQSYGNVGRFIRERLAVSEGSEVKGRFEDKKPGWVVNHYGKGTTSYVGTMFFADVLKTDLYEASRFFNELLDSVGFVRDKDIYNVSGGGIVEVRQLVGEGYEFVFVINHSMCEERVTVAVNAGAYKHAVEIIEDRTPESSRLDGKWMVQETLKPLQVKVYRLSDE